MLVRVTLSQNRHERGRLEVLDGEQVRFVCDCLGKADSVAAAQAGNPERDPLRRGGDLPTGTYSGCVSSVIEPRRSYGPHPAIRLTPTGGEAAIADRNGRAGLLAHGGDPNPEGKLRPTHGCLRLADCDQEELVRLVDAAGGVCQWIVEELVPAPPVRKA